MIISSRELLTDQRCSQGWHENLSPANSDFCVSNKLDTLWPSFGPLPPGLLGMRRPLGIEAGHETARLGLPFSAKIHDKARFRILSGHGVANGLKLFNELNLDLGVMRDTVSR